MSHLIILGAIDFHVMLIKPSKRLRREINSRGYDTSSLIVSIFIRNSERTFPVSVSRRIYYALE